MGVPTYNKDLLINYISTSQMATKRKLVKFQAVRTIKKPTTVKFITKTGQTISFRAIETIKKPVVVKFYAKKKKK